MNSTSLTQDEQYLSTLDEQYSEKSETLEVAELGKGRVLEHKGGVWAPSDALRHKDTRYSTKARGTRQGACGAWARAMHATTGRA